MWQNNHEEKNFQLLNNFEHHIDWVNDLCISKTNNLLFSCSNDKTINIWKIPEINNLNSVNTITAEYQLNKSHKDYIKAIVFNEENKLLFSCGYEGLIFSNDIEEYNKSSQILQDNLIYSSQGNNSIYAMDCDLSGKILIASQYENNIVGIDTRQKKEILHLRGHKHIIRGLRLSNDGKIAVSISSDKTVKLWDMRRHKVLKNLEFHTDSVHSLFVNENFTKILTGSRNGEIFMTLLPLGCYYSLDKVNETVTSLTMNSDMEILATTHQSNLYEYKFNKNEKSSKSNGIDKKITNNNDKNLTVLIKNYVKNIDTNSSLIKSETIFTINEIIRYHLMKNKIYIICATKNKIIFYNVMKLKKIAEFNLNPNNNFTFEKLLEVIDNYDTQTLKSWFTFDIKLGVISIQFNNENLFKNTSNFDQDYLEKVLDRTNSFSKLIGVDFKFINNDELSLSITNSPNIYQLSNSMINTKLDSKDNLTNKSYHISASMQTKKPSQPQIEKNQTCGYKLIQIIFSNFNNKRIKEYQKFFEEYFYDTKDYLKYLFKDENENNLNANFFIYSVTNNSINVGPYLEDITENFQIPQFVKEIQKVIYFNLSPPPKTKKDKIELIIDNKRSDLRNKSNNQESDDLEACCYITVEAFKKWLINSYIDVDYIRNVMIQEDLKNTNLTGQQIKIFEEKYFLDPSFIFNCIDFYVSNGLFVKNPQITISQLKEILFPNKSLSIVLRYVPIKTLIERKIIKL